MGFASVFQPHPLLGNEAVLDRPAKVAGFEVIVRARVFGFDDRGYASISAQRKVKVNPIKLSPDGISCKQLHRKGAPALPIGLGKRAETLVCESLVELVLQIRN